MSHTFHRDRYTWLAYLLLAYYGYFLNILGPITPFLKAELALSYTVSSLHFTAFAVGILIVGLFGHLLIDRIGRAPSLWLGAFGLSLGAFLLLAGRSSLVTIGASFFMGLVGSLILVLVPTVLSDQHGELRAVALSEANVVASLVSAAAPLMVGWSSHLPVGWRLSLGLVAFAPLLLWLGFRQAAPPPSAAPPVPDVIASAAKQSPISPEPLPPLFWVYWVALVLAVSVEFCMISWSADYLENSLRMPKVAAAQSVSLFFVAMIVGRLLGSRLVRSFSVHRVIVVSILVAGLGFWLYWTAAAVAFGLLGLFVTGLGVAGLYPLLLSLAISVAGPNAVQAGARATLASGVAILALPLVLGRLADQLGIHSAYSVVGVLLVAVFLIVLLTRGRESAPGLRR